MTTPTVKLKLDSQWNTSLSPISRNDNAEGLNPATILGDKETQTTEYASNAPLRARERNSCDEDDRDDDTEEEIDEDDNDDGDDQARDGSEDADISLSSDSDNSLSSCDLKDEEDEESTKQTFCDWEGCGQDHDSLEALVKHIHNEHIGNRKAKYTCGWNGCLRKGMTQTSRFALVSHMRLHTKERPFCCTLPECDKSFSRADGLNKHKRQIHGLTDNDGDKAMHVESAESGGEGEEDDYLPLKSKWSTSHQQNAYGQFRPSNANVPRPKDFDTSVAILDSFQDLYRIISGDAEQQNRRLQQSISSNKGTRRGQHQDMDVEQYESLDRTGDLAHFPHNLAEFDESEYTKDEDYAELYNYLVHRFNWANEESRMLMKDLKAAELEYVNAAIIKEMALERLIKLEIGSEAETTLR